MARTLSYSRVSVTVATRLALEEAGAVRSPKYAPLSTAPAINAGGTPPDRARVIRMTPTVPTTPKLVPSA